jgi:hypothetical protein
MTTGVRAAVTVVCPRDFAGLVSKVDVCWAHGEPEECQKCPKITEP